MILPRVAFTISGVRQVAGSSHVTALPACVFSPPYCLKGRLPWQVYDHPSASKMPLPGSDAPPNRRRPNSSSRTRSAARAALVISPGHGLLPGRVARAAGDCCDCRACSGRWLAVFQAGPGRSAAVPARGFAGDVAFEVSWQQSPSVFRSARVCVRGCIALAESIQPLIVPVRPKQFIRSQRHANTYHQAPGLV